MATPPQRLRQPDRTVFPAFADSGDPIRHAFALIAGRELEVIKPASPKANAMKREGRDIYLPHRVALRDERGVNPPPAGKIKEGLYGGEPTSLKLPPSLCELWRTSRRPRGGVILTSVD